MQEDMIYNYGAKLISASLPLVYMFAVPDSPELLKLLFLTQAGVLISATDKWIREKTNIEQAFKYIATFEKKLCS